MKKTVLMWLCVVLMSNTLFALSLSNEQLTIKFDDQLGDITSIRTADRYEYINLQAASLWQMELREIPSKPLSGDSRISFDPEQNDGTKKSSEQSSGGDYILLDSKDFSDQLTVKRTDSGAVELVWTGIDVGRGDGVLDVRVTASLTPGSQTLDVQSAFDNRSERYTVFYFTSPRVGGITSPDGTPEDDRLATPCYTGRLCYNPIENGILGKNNLFLVNRSEHSMQFDAWYNQGNGLFLSPRDGGQNIKRYSLSADEKNGFTWGLVNVPNNMKAVPQVWETPYTTAVQVFSGDWYDAAMIYREWAVNQSWCGEGQLHLRTSTPTWYKEINGWFTSNLQGDSRIELLKKVRKDMPDMQIGSRLRHWQSKSDHAGHPDDDLPLKRQQTIDYFRGAPRLDLVTEAYCQGVMWGPKTKSYEEFGDANCMRNFSGQRRIWDFSHRNQGYGVIVWPGEKWAELLSELNVKMAKMGVKAVYLDSNNHAGTYLNFNEHSTDVGGGNAYIKANQQMISKVKAAAREVFPGYCASAESFWEGNMAHLDAILTWNNNLRLQGEDTTEAIPLAHAVYHDYIIMYSDWKSIHDLGEKDGIPYVTKAGEAFVWGVKPGSPQPDHLYKSRFANIDIALRTTIDRFAAHIAAKKYLVYGQMLRPITVEGDNPVLEMKYYRAWTKNFYTVTKKAVQSSIWRSPEGETGIVLYNVSPEPRTVRIEIDKKTYGLSDAVGEVVAVWPADDEDASCKSIADALIIHATVAPQSPLILDLK